MIFIGHKGGENIREQIITKDHNLLMFAMVFVGLVIIFSYSMGNVSAASGDNIYVNASGNDSWDGLNSTYVNDTNGPKATIKNATSTVNSNGTVYIASGTYKENNIQINKNMTIIGENQLNTIIDGTYSGNIFNIPLGVNLTIINLTIINGKSTTGAGIESSGTLNVQNCTFRGNSATGYGGAIDSHGILNVQNCIFTGNSADSYGGAIETYNPLNGINILNVTGSTFIGNSASGAGGSAIDIWTGTAQIHFNRFFGNIASTGSTVYNLVGSNTNATYNWWGSNNPIFGPYDPTIHSPWLYMTIAAVPTAGSTSSVIASFNQAFDGEIVTLIDPASGHLPDGTDVNFSSDSFGTINPWIQTTNGEATSTFTGKAIGDSLISAILDAQTISTNFTINRIPTILDVKNATVLDNQTATLNATLSDINGNLIAGQNIVFTINGQKYSAVTSSNGIATLMYIPDSAGSYDVTVNYIGNDNYASSQGIGFLTVNPASYIYMTITSSNNNIKVGETFTITYKIGNKGPDAATNVVVTIPLPTGFEVSNINGDGKWTYNAVTRTITWTMTSVPVGDPYLYITGKNSISGLYVFGSNISSETYNLNTQGVTPITINTTNNSNSVIPSVNAATTTIPMQHTGVPIIGFILAILMVIGGTLTPRKK